MSVLRLKHSIAKQLSKYTSCKDIQLLPLLRTPKQQKEGQFSLSIPKLLATYGPDSKIQHPVSWCEKIQPDNDIQQVLAKGPNLYIHVNQLTFTRNILQQVYQEKEKYGWADIKHSSSTPPPVVVMDYSSPNIAKPFHAGHLRSTILGNFIKRIHEIMGYKVIGINYFGDWGKQYGLLAVGFKKYGDEQLLKSNPIYHLYDVYVKINRDAKLDPNIDQQANDYFKQMEEGDPIALSQWKTFRELSIQSYKTIYKRLNIEFEVYSGESQVNEYIPKVYDLLNEKKLLKKMEDGALAVDLSSYNMDPVIIQRADGTSLYMTRDLASILMRKEVYHFDKAIYVVGMEQQGYFQQLFAIASLMLKPNHHHHSTATKITSPFLHASFGRIQGMSTRQGTAVFLQDILDTAQLTILDYMQTKEDNSIHHVENNNMATIADQLGISAIFIQDMKSKRNKNYQFAWDRMTDARGDTGILLQYAHARSCGIERNARVPVTDQCDYSLLQEPMAYELIQTISYFPEVIQSSFETLEPCTIVNYLFKLSHATGLASHTLRVKDVDPELAKSRMLLFWAARITMRNGLTLLGIRPLDKM
ncbi:hypothetical protein BJ944DRAFT_166692 [Cunninghamella echinulata]|nr:hypothetical protein BJ944DRAFT_166692 [Cunninghamella echinulata]